jgi:hypothetical protein
MRAISLIAAAWLFLAFGADAQDVGWRDQHGNPVADSDAQKSKHGFGGWLLITDDPDWEAKWNTPAKEVPHFKEAQSVHVGQTVVALIFISNPAKDSGDNVNVTCDLRLERPDGSRSVDQPDAPCMIGHLPGDPLNLYLADPVMGFLGEASDPVGQWTFHVTLKDGIRKTSLELQSSFTFLNDG